ncbi:MAG: class I SAM-dependent methyltransferase [Azoarcus sp.]|jgi:hypothetical protein|nr:class I SAM-dependent methyltransferase [Azoarcus sp.]
MSNIKLSIDYKDWAEKAQPGELAFHKKPNSRTNTDSFYKSNSELFKKHGFSPNQFSGGVVIDAGAGSRLRAKYFKGCHRIAIEPLGDKYMNEVPWCDLQEANEVISLPIEKEIIRLKNSADFVFSINVLDHCYEFIRSIETIFSYLKPNAICFLTFDCHTEVDDLHPIVVNEKVATAVIYDSGFIISQMSRIEAYHEGIAKYAVAYWLKKPSTKTESVVLR